MIAESDVWSFMQESLAAVGWHESGRLTPNPSLKRRPATAATVWPLQAAVNIILARPTGVRLRGST
jgi:hypothetical protein